MSSTSHSNAQRRGNLQGIDTFLALSEVYLDCIEHLAESTIAVYRAAIEEGVGAMRATAVRSGAPDPAAVPAALGQSLLEKALAYTRDSYETVTNAQLESAQILGRQFATPAIYMPLSNELKGTFDMFTRRFRDFSMTAEGAVAEAANRAGASSRLNKTA
ncbi:phasin family protein [Azoarcus sp. KH32C]|uniref:phasin family protein n=1 Tax=Azoarcus sp. KH32C TaxID=748247 RepID=UPI000238701B|nr:phasin family protein [Azoarcus sp. KH32C]BAL25004.1 hypothetical protein AZKH_2698 [Azoarcus sp. KH32C]